MVDDEEAVNLHPIERIIRVGLGALLLYFGTKVSIIVALLNSSYYTPGTIKYTFAKVIASMPNIWRIFGWTAGFILLFTGANGFCPVYKLLHINTNKRFKKTNL